MKKINQFLPTRKNRWKPVSVMMIKYYGFPCTMLKVLYLSGLIQHYCQYTGMINNKSGQKKLPLFIPGSIQKDSFYVPLIKTGKTPKIISRTADSKYLLVSNWHSYNVSVLEINKDEYPYGKVISTIPVSAIPRGIVVDDKNNRSYVAIMGGASIAVINNTVWMKED